MSNNTKNHWLEPSFFWLVQKYNISTILSMITIKSLHFHSFYRMFTHRERSIHFRKYLANPLHWQIMGHLYE